MNKFKSQKGGITVFVIVAFLFTMIILISIFWKNTNYQVTVLQAEQRIKDTYGKEVNNVDEIYLCSLKGPTGKKLINKDTVATIAEKKIVGEDRYGNPITIPAGFKVAEDSGDDVTQGIVIEDDDLFEYEDGTKRGNQYVWIPTGTIYTDTAMTEANAKEIIAGRYEFADGTSSYVDENNETVTPTVKGTPVLKQRLTDYDVQPTDIVYNSTFSSPYHGITSATNGEIVIKNYYYEVSEYRTGVANSNTTGLNRTAANLSSFAKSVASNHGYYIARYEASWWTGDKVKSRVSTGTPLTSSRTRTAEDNGQLWNFVTEIDAAGYCQNLYASINSDLMNSYAWDTAIVYIQTFSGDTDYSYQTSKNTSGPANTGVNGDKVCNIHDMASNDFEWTTEYSTDQHSGNAGPCVLRGGYYNHALSYTAIRNDLTATTSHKDITFRPTLYL